MVRCAWALVFLSVLAVVPARASARQAGGDDLTNVFYDCQAPACRDFDFVRREIPFVNWVREREVGDVHVLITSLAAGGGGRQYTLDFIGLSDFEGLDQLLEYGTAGDATADEERSGIVERIKLGLVPYVAGTSAADRLRVSYGAPGAGGGPGGPGGPGGAERGGGPGGGPGAAQQTDPWDFWTFRINGNGFVQGQSSSRSSNYFGSFSANRTTEEWKIQLEARYSSNTQEFDLEDVGGNPFTVSETREDWGVSGTLVRSIGGQWALGIRSDAGSSTFLNQDLRVSVMPGIEYDFVPYEESSRRAYTLQYLVGPSHFAYIERTIYGELWETRWQQSLTGRVSLVQPWGRWSTSLTGAQYLHDASKYRVTLSGNLNVRLFRGFSVRMSGNYARIHDQLEIEAGSLTPEEVLLFQRQLETSYRYFTSFGIEYRFGSIFNNVVNPRFGGGGGGGEFFIIG